MQLIILVYHYTGVSQHLVIYVWIRLLVASYIFMSAYGHFSYFWYKGDYSLQRLCQVGTFSVPFVGNFAEFLFCRCSLG
jgi:hypothetical protein